MSRGYRIRWQDSLLNRATTSPYPSQSRKSLCSTSPEAATWLLAQLLDWHRREDKPEWWAHFSRLEQSDDELVDDPESIGELEYAGVVGEVGRSLVHRYRFRAGQEHKLSVGDSALVVDYKTNVVGEGTPEEIVDQDYRLQRLVYALACLRANLVSQQHHSHPASRLGGTRCALNGVSRLRDCSGDDGIEAGSVHYRRLRRCGSPCLLSSKDGGDEQCNHNPDSP